MPWSNFNIWRGRLPHWRASDVTYYATFRHRRDLNDKERHHLFQELMKSEGKKWNLVALCVLPRNTEVIFTVFTDVKGEEYELADIIERAKTRAAKKIQKETEERFSPFYNESYDRIIRDDSELQERFEAILGSPVNEELAQEPDEYPTLYVAGAP